MKELCFLRPEDSGAFGSVTGAAWSVSGRVEVKLKEEGSKVTIRCAQDADNFAEFLLLRTEEGVCALRRNITRQGTRLQATGNERVLNSLQDCEDFSADFHLLTVDGWVYLFLREPGRPMLLATSYAVDWHCSAPYLEVTEGARAVFSHLREENDPAAVRELYRRLAVSGEVKGTAKLLFLGNSCIFFYDTPNTFCRLARLAGYLVEVDTVAKSSAYLSQFDDPETYVGALANARLAKGWDRVILQDNSNILRDEERTTAARKAVRSLTDKVRAAGSEPVLYVRPTTNNYKDGRTPVSFSRQLDEFYLPLSGEKNALCCFANRAFALAYRETGINLWHTDNAHQSEKGSYLAACVLFSTLFGVSCRELDDNGLPPEEAKALRDVAHRVVLEGAVPV